MCELPLVRCSVASCPVGEWGFPEFSVFYRIDLSRITKSNHFSRTGNSLQIFSVNPFFKNRWEPG